MQKVERLRPGDTVALIAPGSPITEEKLNKAIANMHSLGLKVKYNENVLLKHGYLAGSDQARLQDLHEAFADTSVKGIWCIRGGYGCPRLLPRIDYKLIKKNPKLFIGYSDVTALLHAFYKKARLLCFHGPMGVSTFTPFALENIKATLMEPRESWQIKTHTENNVYYSIRKGSVEACLVGGNLSLLCALVGTPYEVDFKNKIVFIEEVGEKPYRIDRMLTQLRQASNLRKAAAIVLGVFADCEADVGDDSLSLKETLMDRIYDLGIPAFYGFPTGHIKDQCVLPIGGRVRFNTEKGLMTFIDEYVR